LGALTGLSALSGLSGVAGGAAASLTENTAYVSSTGNNATAVLGDVAKPYITLQAASSALKDAYPTQATTIILQSNLVSSQTLNKQVYQGFSSLTLDGAGFTLGDLQLESPDLSSVLTLTLKDIAITGTLNTSTGCVGTNGASANLGTIRHIGEVTVGAFHTCEPSNPQATAGADGTPAYTGTGLTGNNGTDGSMFGFPTDGTTGESINSTGGNGSVGEAGRAAWSVSLLEGTGFVSANYTGALNLRGSQGGNGGNGGGNSGATGGAGGAGGHAYDDGAFTPQNGANGGAGGDCYITGGNGGDGGVGGDGGTLTYASTIVIDQIGTLDNIGGFGGNAGYGGSVSASGGAGGAGGNGVNGGSTGNVGNIGSFSQTSGSNGNTPGVANSGSVVVV